MVQSEWSHQGLSVGWKKQNLNALLSGISWKQELSVTVGSIHINCIEVHLPNFVCNTVCPRVRMWQITLMLP